MGRLNRTCENVLYALEPHVCVRLRIPVRRYIPKITLFQRGRIAAAVYAAAIRRRCCVRVRDPR